MTWKEKVKEYPGIQEMIPRSEIVGEITNITVEFAQKFGSYLGTDERVFDRNGRQRISDAHLNTNQLRKFFGEVKRQQVAGFNQSEFILLKPKLAYAVGRADKNSKIRDFYLVISDAMDNVSDEKSFRNFIKLFEAIVAYHKAAVEGMIINK